MPPRLEEAAVRIRTTLVASAVAAAAAALAAGASSNISDAGSAAGVTVVKGKGKTVAAIRPTVVRFRNLLGSNNGGAPGGDPAGYREINWDSVPDELAAPYALPADFFNAPTDPRARGIVLNTPGDHVAVSADRDNPSGARVRFGDVNPTYARQFKAFSAERLFSPIGSNVVNVTFFVPGTDTPGVVNSFGAVYTDVDRAESASFEYFDAQGARLGRYSVPARPQGFSFLGVVFDEPAIARVRIRYGNRALGPTETRRYDVAVMDNFIYGEPQAIHLPAKR
jgi:hypothetical protein